MPRTITPQTAADLYAQQTDAAFITLMIIQVPQTGSQTDYDKYYLTDNPVDIQSRAEDGSTLQTYHYFPMSVQMPRSENNKISQGQLTVSNATKELIDFVTSRDRVILIELMEVNTKELDIPVTRWPCYSWRQVVYDVDSIRGALTLQDFLGENYPGRTMGPSIFPGLF